MTTSYIVNRQGMELLRPLKHYPSEALEQKHMDLYTRVALQTGDERTETLNEIAKLLSSCYYMQRYRYLIEAGALFCSVAASVAVFYASMYGWNKLAAPLFGLPSVTLMQTALLCLLLRLIARGEVSHEQLRQHTERRVKWDALRWFDRVHKRIDRSLSNFFVSGFFVFVFWWLV